MDAAHRISRQDPLTLARATLRQEAASLLQLADGLGAEFKDALDLLDRPNGNVVVTGMGKAGLIGQKISATFCSTGTRSFFLHPAEAIHGDLGRVMSADAVLALSMSGETEELVRVLPSFVELAESIVAITSRSTSTLGRFADKVIQLGPIAEACPLGLAPSTSTTSMLALGDALALALSERRGFQAKDFAKFHPGGSLGRQLTKVQEVMRPLADCRVAQESQSVRDTFVTLRRTGRRVGAVMIVDTNSRLTGVFTDSDLARLLEQQSDASLDAPVHTLMTCNPITVPVNTLMPEAVRLLGEKQISELPVVDPAGHPLGIIDITDIIAWIPAKLPVAEPDGGALEIPCDDAPASIIPFPGQG